MSYSYGARSRAEMQGMHPDLIRVLNKAITITKQDYTIFDGKRTAREQNALFRRGASKLDGYNRISKHQEQRDGYVHAADLVPWRDSDGDGDNEVHWYWPAIYVIAEAMFTAAVEENVQLRWGGCWQHINPVADVPPETLVEQYVRRKLKAGKRAFNDGPHWELYGYL